MDFERKVNCVVWSGERGPVWSRRWMVDIPSHKDRLAQCTSMMNFAACSRVSEGTATIPTSPATRRREVGRASWHTYRYPKHSSSPIQATRAGWRISQGMSMESRADHQANPNPNRNPRCNPQAAR